MSNLEEDIRQVAQLEEAILRLCNEADNNGIILNSLLSSLVTFSVKVGLSPTDLTKTFIFYINAIVDKRQQENIRNLVEKEVEKQSTKSPRKRKRL